MKIINKYVIKEFFPQFILGVIVFTFILLMEKIFYLTNLILGKGVDLVYVLKLFMYLLPSFCSFTFPMSFLMGTLLSLGRLQDDNEITALRAGGVPQFKIIMPIIVISILTSCFLTYFNQFIVPNSQKKFTKIYYDIAHAKPMLKFEENKFFDINEYKFFIKKIDRKTNKLEDIIIYQTKDNYPLLITSKYGRIKVFNGKIMLFLDDGFIQQKDQNNLNKFTYMKFDSYTINFDISEAEKNFVDYSSSIINLSGREIKEQIKTLQARNINIVSLKVQYYQRISLAIACFIFVLVASSLSIRSNKHTKSIAFGLSLIFIFIFYVLLALGISLAEKNILPPEVSVNLPNFILGLIGIFFMIRSNNR